MQSAQSEPVTMQMSSLDLLFLLDETEDLDLELGCDSTSFEIWPESASLRTALA